MILKFLERFKDSFYNDYTYYYKVITKSNDLASSLEEILNYVEKDPQHFKPISNFQDKNKTSNNWGIYIDGMIFISSWEGEYNPTEKEKKWKKFFPLRECDIFPGLITIKSIIGIGNGKKNKGINFYITTIKNK